MIRCRQGTKAMSSIAAEIRRAVKLRTDDGDRTKERADRGGDLRTDVDRTVLGSFAKDANEPDDPNLSRRVERGEQRRELALSALGIARRDGKDPKDVEQKARIEILSPDIDELLDRTPSTAKQRRMSNRCERRMRLNTTKRHSSVDHLALVEEASLGRALLGVLEHELDPRDYLFE